MQEYIGIQKKENTMRNTEQENENAERYIIGHAPAGMGNQLGKDGLGLQWNKNDGWHTKDPEKAQAAHSIILEQQPRYYLEGNTYAVKDMIATINKEADSPEGKIFYDPLVKKRYAISLEVHEAVQANIPAEPEKRREAELRHYLTGESLAVKDQLKELGCRWDAKKQQWYAPGEVIAVQAQAVIDNNGRHYIPNVPFNLNEKVREMGCQWDSREKCWFHVDPAKAQEIERLANAELERSPNHGRQSVVQAVVKEVAHEM